MRKKTKGITEFLFRFFDSGIVVTNHHFNLLGLNTFRFPDKLRNDWNWREYPQLMSFAWKKSADSMKRLKFVVITKVTRTHVTHHVIYHNFL